MNQEAINDKKYVEFIIELCRGLCARYLSIVAVSDEETATTDMQLSFSTPCWMREEVKSNI